MFSAFAVIALAVAVFGVTSQEGFARRDKFISRSAFMIN